MRTEMLFVSSHWQRRVFFSKSHCLTHFSHWSLSRLHQSPHQSCLSVCLLQLRSRYSWCGFGFFNWRWDIVLFFRGEVRALQLVVLVCIAIVKRVRVLMHHDHGVGGRRPFRSTPLVKQILVDEVKHLITNVVSVFMLHRIQVLIHLP